MHRRNRFAMRERHETREIGETIAVRELATKADLESQKADIVKWVAGLLVAQAALVAALVKLVV